MSTEAHPARGGLFADLLGHIEAFLLHPVDRVDPSRAEAAARVAVVALGPNVGTTTLAGLLASELAARSATPPDLPLVTEVAHGDEAGAAMSLATAAIVVGGRETDIALAHAVAQSLSRVGPYPSTVGIGADPEAGWDHLVPWSRSAVLLARAGLRPPGGMRTSVDELVRSIAPLVAVRA